MNTNRHNPRIIKRVSRSENHVPDFELIFSASGSVELVEVDKHTEILLWSSDEDEDFAEEFGDDFFDGEDAEEIIEYLIDNEYVDENSAIDILEEDLEDEEIAEYDDDDLPVRVPMRSSGNVIEGEFVDKSKRKRKRK